MTDTTQPGADNALDLDAIEAAASAATPGPWEYRPMGETTDPEIAAANGSRVCSLVGADMTKQNSRFIAAANPAAVRALIALARRAAQPVEAEQFDFYAHLARQAAWSSKTFGPGPRTAGVCDHIRKELREIEADPTDLREWIDVVILALDGAWRCGGSPEQIISGIVAKQTKNEGRNWPDWRTADPNKAIEHDRTGEVATHPAEPAVPIPMILHCPQCHAQHIDAPDERTPDWKNEPHRSHLCHGCGHIWRPADVPTEGVRAIWTKGSKDSGPAVGGALVAHSGLLARLYERHKDWAERSGHAPMAWEEFQADRMSHPLTASAIEREQNPEAAKYGIARAISAAPAGALVAITEPVELMGVHEQLEEGAGFWHSCSGCHETEDGHPVGQYAYSNALGCALGNGCSECGGLGAVWDNNDYEAMAKEWDSAESSSTGSAAGPVEQTQAARDVLAERRRQVEQEGWKPEHDDKYQSQELRSAALCYMRAETITKPGVLPGPWPWAAKWWKPTTDRRNLVKAVGLLISEIERLDRASPQPIPTKGNGDTDKGEQA